MNFRSCTEFFVVGCFYRREREAKKFFTLIFRSIVAENVIRKHRLLNFITKPESTWPIAKVWLNSVDFLRASCFEEVQLQKLYIDAEHWKNEKPHVWRLLYKYFFWTLPKFRLRSPASSVLLAIGWTSAEKKSRTHWRCSGARSKTGWIKYGCIIW